MVTPFLCSAADLQLIRAEHLPNGGVNVVAHVSITTGAINVEPGVRDDGSSIHITPLGPELS
jgi:hypothetical protein